MVMPRQTDRVTERKTDSKRQTHREVGGGGGGGEYKEKRKTKKKTNNNNNVSVCLIQCSYKGCKRDKRTPKVTRDGQQLLANTPNWHVAN